MTKRERLLARLRESSFDPQAVSDAVLESPLHGREKLVALALLSHWSRRNPIVEVGTRRLAALATCRLQAAQDALRGLARQGLVTTTTAPGCVTKYSLAAMPAALAAILSDPPPESQVTRRRNHPGDPPSESPGDPVSGGKVIPDPPRGDPPSESKGSKKAPRKVPAEEGLVSCPLDLILSDDQLGVLEINNGCRRPDALKLCAHFTGKWHHEEPRRRSAWLKALWTAVVTAWQNPVERARLLPPPGLVEHEDNTGMTECDQRTLAKARAWRAQRDAEQAGSSP